jgi:hypothetical protein
MGKLIVFYVPMNFTAQPVKWVAPSARGRIIEFRNTVVKKSA